MGWHKCAAITYNCFWRKMRMNIIMEACRAGGFIHWASNQGCVGFLGLWRLGDRGCQDSSQVLPVPSMSLRSGSCSWFSFVTWYRSAPVHGDPQGEPQGLRVFMQEPLYIHLCRAWSTEDHLWVKCNFLSICNWIAFPSS